jgi:hypothetical protein
VIVLLIAPAILLYSIGLAFAQSSGVYHNDKYGFSIQPPSGWTATESGLPTGTAVKFWGPTDENYTVNFDITLINPQGMALDEIISEVKQIMPQNLTNYQIVSERSRVIGGVDAYEIV